MKKIYYFGLLLIILSEASGCTAFMHGFTKNTAMNQYMLVSKEMETFGYKRIKYIIGYHGAAIKSFVDEKGYPDYLYEFETEGRMGFIFYYIAKNKAYDFREISWRPNSSVLFWIRGINEFERLRFGIDS